jgi:hypothetical protein
MNTNEERSARWYAYYLGELPEAERAGVEAELAAAPVEAEEVRRVCLGVETWASEPIAGKPLDVHGIFNQADAPFGAAKPRRMAVLTKAWPWAAAAAFLIAISQISFSIQFGDSTIAWGQAIQQPAGGVPSEAIERLNAIETAAAKTQADIATVATRAASIETEMRDTTAELAYNQQLESQARYSDVQRILTLTGLGNYSMAAMYEP